MYNKDEIKKIAESPVLLTAFLTASGYSAGYAYNFGYLSKFGVSYQFIDVSIGILILAIGATAITILAALMWIQGDRRYAKKHKGKTRVHLRRIAFLVPILTLVLYSYDLLTVRFLSLIILGLAAASLMLIVKEVFAARNLKKGLKEFWKKLKYGREKDEYDDVSSILPDRIGGYIAFLLLLAYISFVLGTINGKVMQKYTVLKDDNPIKMVLIQKTSNTLIFKRYDTEAKRLLDGYVTMKPDTPQSYEDLDTTKLR